MLRQGRQDMLSIIEKVLFRLRLLHAAAAQSLDLQGVIFIVLHSVHVLFPFDGYKVLKLEILVFTLCSRKFTTVRMLFLPFLAACGRAWRNSI